MPFKFANIFGGNKSATQNRLTISTMVGVTEMGKREVGKYSSGGTTFDVIAPLDDRSPQPVSSLMKETGYKFEEIAPVLEMLEKQKYVEFFGRD